MQSAVARKPSPPTAPSHSQPAPRARGMYAPGIRRWLVVSLALLVGLGLGWLATRFATQGRVTTWQYRIVREFPHDRQAYTQGLVFHQGLLYEGTGRYGNSDLRKVELESGRVLHRVPLANRYFGEGITIWNDKIFQLTWRERTALEYDLATLQPTGRTFRYSGEGWGLTHDGRHLIMSDGTSVLRFLDPDTWQVVRRISVRDGRQRILNLNELQYIKGEIFANIWKQDYLVRISPRNGNVLGWVDLRGLWPLEEHRGEDHVLNGIAYDPPTERLFVTGKNWPKLFQIDLIPANQ